VTVLAEFSMAETAQVFFFFFFFSPAYICMAEPALFFFFRRFPAGCPGFFFVFPHFSGGCPGLIPGLFIYLFLSRPCGLPRVNTRVI
jgi:hypothetical protein